MKFQKIYFLVPRPSGVSVILQKNQHFLAKIVPLKIPPPNPYFTKFFLEISMLITNNWYKCDRFDGNILYHIRQD